MTAGNRPKARKSSWSSSSSSSSFTSVKTSAILVVGIVLVTILYLFYPGKDSNTSTSSRLRHDDVHVRKKTGASATVASVRENQHFEGCESPLSNQEDEDEDDEEEDAFDMPSWMSDYFDFHKRHVQKAANGGFRYNHHTDSGSSSEATSKDDNGYIQWICRRSPGGKQELSGGRRRPEEEEGHCGGLGDRLYGIVMTLYLAMLTNRTLLVQGWNYNSAGGDNDNDNDTSTCLLSLQAFLRPAHIQWNAADVVDDPDDDQAGGAASLSPHHVPAVFQVSTLDNRSHPYLQEPCTSIPTQYPRIQIQNNIMTYDSILQNSSHCFLDYWKKHRHHHDEDDDDDDDTDDTRSLFYIGFWTLFRFTPRVYQHANYLREMAGMAKMTTTTTTTRMDPKSHDESSRHETTTNVAATPHHRRRGGKNSLLFRPYIGVHIRTGQGESWNDPIRHGSSTTTLQQFYQCALKLQRGMHQKQIQQQLAQHQQQCPSATSSSSTSTIQPLPPLPLPDIYLASDNAGAKMQIQRWDRRQQRQNHYPSIKTLVDMDILHIDKTRVNDLQHNSVHANDNNNPDTTTASVLEQAYLNVWGEFQILRDASCLVTSRSKFSDLAVELNSHYRPRRRRRGGSGGGGGGRPQLPAQKSTYHGDGRCAVVFDDCSDEQVARALENYNYSDEAPPASSSTSSSVPSPPWPLRQCP